MPRPSPERRVHLDPREAFLASVRTLILAFVQLAGYRIVGNAAIIAVGISRTEENEACGASPLRTVKELRSISPQEFGVFQDVFHESCVVLAYSWLETFLAEVEEALFLFDPNNLGESVQIKLGKILESASIMELVHDVARRRVRDHSQWGLGNRLADLRKQGFKFTTPDAEVERLVVVRNAIVHDRRPGEFEVRGRRVAYKAGTRMSRVAADEASRLLSTVFAALDDLYRGACRKMKITGRFAKHKENLTFIASMRRPWGPRSATPGSRGSAVRSVH